MAEKKENPKLVVIIEDGKPIVELVQWELFNARMMERVNREISRQRLRLRRGALRESKVQEARNE